MSDFHRVGESQCLHQRLVELLRREAEHAGLAGDRLAVFAFVMLGPIISGLLLLVLVVVIMANLLTR